MLQVLQSLKDGTIEVADVPATQVRENHVLVRTRCSVISAGTERMLLEFGKGSWLAKARQQPDKVRLTLDKIRTDGLLPTLESVRSKLDQPLAMGYSNCGEITRVGENCENSGLQVGDRVACNGHHAEVVCVPHTLCARVPDTVPDEHAAFTVLGSIALQGVRLATPTLGECFVVIGLGLIGLLSVQTLLANGCRVLGIDLNPDRSALAKLMGAEVAQGDTIAAAREFSAGKGVDGVLITASTRSNELVHQAAEICRKRGRIILVGVAGLKLSRADFYEKELTFQVSCSYGPGRYDPAYEDRGQDYPQGFVRWTAQRNFSAVLDLMKRDLLQITPLITHRFKLDEASTAYQQVAQGEALGILLEYPWTESKSQIETRTSVRVSEGPPTSSGKGIVGFLGAGNYARRILIPAFREAGAELKTVVSLGGMNSFDVGRKFKFENSASDPGAVFDDDAIDTIVIATRHNSHCQLILRGLESGKHVFVEKPLCLTITELNQIRESYQAHAANRKLVVGFNRRFAPLTLKIKDLLRERVEPAVFIMMVNAGEIPADHWTQDRATGGGRIIGEACHFIDLLRHLSGASISGFQASCLGPSPGMAVKEDKATITLQFGDGSLGIIHYLANGHRAYPKERLEIFCQNRVIVMDNFIKLTGYGWPGQRKQRLWRQDKGHQKLVSESLKSIRTGAVAPIPFEEIEEVSRASLEIDSLLKRSP